MWQAIQYVGTPLALLAFLAAIAAYIYNVRADKIKHLISSSPEAGRADLIESLLRDFKVVNVNDLTRSQRYDIVNKILDEKRYRLKIIAISFLSTFLMLSLVLVFTHYRSQVKTPPSPTTDLAPKSGPGQSAASGPSAASAQATVTPVAVTYEPAVAYKDIRIQKPTSWFLVNDGESPTFSIENPNDPSVYITISPQDRPSYESIDGIKCTFLKNISAGSVGPEADGVAVLDKCRPVYDGKQAEELVLFIKGKIDYAIRCGYDEDKAPIYREVCNTIIGSARYVGTSE